MCFEDAGVVGGRIYGAYAYSVLEGVGLIVLPCFLILDLALRWGSR
jgi:hypothetical protein